MSLSPPVPPWDRSYVLAEPAQAGDTQLPVKCWARIDSEELYVLLLRPRFIDSRWEAVERGVNGTAPATHSAGARVLWWDTSEERWWDDVDQEWVD